MSIGLLLITHNNIGSSLLETATVMLGLCPLQTEALAVTTASDPDNLRREALEIIDKLDLGDGVLVLTDIFGSTPSNIACTLQDEEKVSVVAGINLPMLVRVLNYPQLDLAAMTEIAISGGHIGIMPYCPRNL